MSTDPEALQLCLKNIIASVAFLGDVKERFGPFQKKIAIKTISENQRI